MWFVGTDNPAGPTPTWPHHPHPLPLALLSQSEGRAEGALAASLHRTSSIQGLLGQHLSSSQLSFSSSMVLPPLPAPERFFCPGGRQEGAGAHHHHHHHGGARAGLGLVYDNPYGKWSLSGRKGFNGPPPPGDSDAGAGPTARTQVNVRAGPSVIGCGSSHNQGEPPDESLVAIPDKNGQRSFDRWFPRREL